MGLRCDWMQGPTVAVLYLTGLYQQARSEQRAHVAISDLAEILSCIKSNSDQRSASYLRPSFVSNIGKAKSRIQLAIAQGSCRSFGRVQVIYHPHICASAMVVRQALAECHDLRRQHRPGGLQGNEAAVLSPSLSSANTSSGEVMASTRL